MSIGNGRAARQPLQITLERVTHFLGGILVGLLYVASLPYEILYVGRATVCVCIYGNGTRTSGAKLRDAGRQCKHFFFVVLRCVSFSGHSGAVGMGALYQRTSAEPKILRRKDQGKAHLQNNKQERCVDRVVRLRAMVIAVCLVEFADEAGPTRFFVLSRQIVFTKLTSKGTTHIQCFFLLCAFSVFVQLEMSSHSPYILRFRRLCINRH